MTKKIIDFMTTIILILVAIFALISLVSCKEVEERPTTVKQNLIVVHTDTYDNLHKLMYEEIVRFRNIDYWVDLLSNHLEEDDTVTVESSGRGLIRIYVNDNSGTWYWTSVDTEEKNSKITQYWANTIETKVNNR
jgi:hypothetical protein